MDDIFDVIGLLISIAALIVAIYIPIVIERNQNYGSLITDYRSYDFAAAVQGVINFFTIDCGCDFSKIQKAYEKRFLSEVGTATENRLVSNRIDNSHILHYQRRMLNSYFYQLDLCARYGRRWKRRIQVDFTKGEANLLKIIFYMNKTVDESPLIFKDISNYEHMPKQNNTKGMNRYIADLYSVLEKSSRYIK